MSNGLLNASGLTTPKVTTEEIILKGKPISDALANESNVKIIAPHALGDFYFSITSHMPEGVLPLNGSEVSRVTYSDLYDYVLNIHNELVTSDKKFIVSEEEWQNISIENNGYVPYYSYGTIDGMFRLPRMSGYLKATGEVDEAGNYIAEGLPNITGTVGCIAGAASANLNTGAFAHGGTCSAQITNGGENDYKATFDASRSNSIYGNSEHVTPETNTLFVGVWALVAFTQVGTANLSEIKEIFSQCETILGDSLPLLSSRYDNKGLETSAWKLSDGSWLDGRIYADAYNKVLQRFTEGDTVCLEMKESELLSSTEFPENFLIDIEGIKFRLPLFVVNERTIIKEYKDGTSWYTLYSDGWCEQGALATTSSVTFLIPFEDSEYSLTTANVGTNSTATYEHGAISSRTATGFTWPVYDSFKLMYRAAGYAADLLPREEWEIDFNYYFKVSHGVDEGRINIEEKLTEFEETAYTRLDEVVEEVSKDYVVHVDKQVGELYFSFNDYFPDGVIPLDGRLVSRATYADLWEWVQEKGLVKDDTLITTNDENTVSIFNEDGTVRYCQWYGSGDGSLTFRMPKINGYGKLTGDNTIAGQYIQEGLPNLEGNINKAPTDYAVWNVDGVFSKTTDSAGATRGGGGGEPKMTNVNFNASRYNSIYGNSEHVTPETNTLFVGVWAITVAKAAVFDMRDVEEALKSAESYLMNNVPLMSSRWDRDGLGNLGWVKADGSWIDGRTYTGAYNYCVEKLVSGHDDFIDGQVAAITTDNCSKFIVDRINKRFRLPITNGQRQLIAAYKEGTQWYNIYSDGWIEQGGEIYNSADAVVTVELLVPYNDTTYTVDKILGVDARYTSTVSGDYTSTWGYTTSSFQARTHTNAALNRFRWFAKGYAEILDISSPERTAQLYFKLAHEFYAPAEAVIQEKLDIIDNLAGKIDINLPTLSSRWDSDFAENIGWVKSEGQWLNGNIYRDAYEMMVSRIGVNDKFVAADTGTELTDENADKFLIDTSAVKFRLPIINGERVLVAKYISSSAWYNHYSDGYIEQGGTIGNTGSITYPKPFINKTYHFSRSAYGLNTSAGSYYAYGGSGTGSEDTRTTTGVTFTTGAYCKGYLWKAEGQSDIPSLDDYTCGTYLYFKLGDAVPSTVVDTQSIIDDLHQKCNDYQDTMDAILALGSDYICGCMIPDYTTGIDLTSNVETVMPYHAWIMARCQNDNSNGWAQIILQVNGATVGVANVTNNCQDTCSCFVKKGDTVIAKTSGESGTRTYVTKYFRLSGASVE